MTTTHIHAVVGGPVAFWNEAGELSRAQVVELADDGSYAKLQVFEGAHEASYVPRRGRRDAELRWCWDELEVEDFDPLAEPPETARANPIGSIVTWCAAVQTPLRNAEAYCMEEMAEVLSAFYVHDGESRDHNQGLYAEALKEYSKLLRQYRQLEVASDDLSALLDGHLDSAWVHLLAAAQIVGPENLAAAWSRLHRANIDGKQVDGRFVLDSTGKVTKPEGWQPPVYNDLIKKEIL